MMMVGLVLILAVFSAVTAKPLPDGESDQSIKQEIPHVPELLQMSDMIAAASSGETNSIFTTTWPSSQYQTSNAGDFSTGLSDPSQPSTAGDISAVLPSALIPTNLGGNAPTTATTGELVSDEALYQSDPPCIGGFWPACCNGNKFCIWSKSVGL